MSRNTVAKVVKKAAEINLSWPLDHDTYCGDKLLGKTFPKDFITKKPLPDAACEKNYLKNDHEAIVDPELWNAVQNIFRQNLELKAKVGKLGGSPHFLYGKLFCKECGNPMRRNSVTGGQGKNQKVWVCRERLKGKYGNGCRGAIVKEEELLKVMERVIGGPVTKGSVEGIQRITVSQDGLHMELVYT